MKEESLIRPALIGGVLLGIFSSLPLIGLFNCVCCAWVIGGGLLAAHLYVKESPVPVTLGRGVTLGLVTGVIGTLASALFEIPLYLLMNRSGANLMDTLRERIDNFPGIPPETRDLLQKMWNQPDTVALIVVFGFLFMLVLYCLFAVLGATIGVALFEKRKTGAGPDAAPQDPPPMQLPGE